MHTNFVNPPAGQSLKPGDKATVILRFDKSPEKLQSLSLQAEEWKDGKAIASTGFSFNNSSPTDSTNTKWQVFGFVPHIPSGDYKVTVANMTVAGASTTVQVDGPIFHVDASEPPVFPKIVSVTPGP